MTFAASIHLAGGVLAALSFGPVLDSPDGSTGMRLLLRSLAGTRFSARTSFVESGPGDLRS
jgi:hypothetical protein